MVMDTSFYEDLCIYHFILGAPCSVNDLNALDISLLFSEVCAGEWSPASPLSINFRARTITYCLLDGIYPKYPFFAAPYSIPVTAREISFNRLQEAVKKDFERLYAVMTSHSHVKLRPIRSFFISDIVITGGSVPIMHNMITVLWRNSTFREGSRPTTTTQVFVNMQV